MAAYRRRCVLLVDIVSIDAYLRLVKPRRVPKPNSCANCRAVKFHWNGSYLRGWVDSDCLVVELRILKVRCCACRVSWTLIPGFVLRRFRFSPGLLEWACWAMLAGKSSVVLHERLRDMSSVLEERATVRVPAESTLRFWLGWLGGAPLQKFVRLALSFLARMDAELAARAYRLVAAPQSVGGDNTLSIGRALGAPLTLAPTRSRVRRRAGVVLKACVAVSALGGKSFRRRRHQLRDWARWLFREHRLTLCRPP